MANIKKIDLPTNGVLNAPKQITIRELTGKDLSALYSNFNEEALDYVIKQAIIEPEEIDLDSLATEDKTYILHALRVLTFGSEVEQTLRCPFCGKVHDYVINYDDFALNKIPSDYLTHGSIAEIAGKAIERTIPTIHKLETIRNFKEQMKISDHDDYILLLMGYINTVDNKKLSPLDLRDFLINLPGRDLVKVEKHVDVKYGFDTTFTVECESCSVAITGGIGLNAHIFR